MKVQFADNGEIIEAKRCEDIVNHMRETSPFISSENNHEYMIGYAQRAVISNNEDIRATSENDFIEDLIKLGHIKLINKFQKHLEN